MYKVVGAIVRDLWGKFFTSPSAVIRYPRADLCGVRAGWGTQDAGQAGIKPKGAHR